MRKLRIMMGLATTVFAGCWMGGNGDKGMEGTYVNHSKGEFSIADDTLKVLKLDGRQFRVLRSTGFNLIRADTVGRREFEREEWTIVYDQSISAYRQVGRGKVIRCDDRAKMLRVGNRDYSKIR